MNKKLLQIFLIFTLIPFLMGASNRSFDGSSDEVDMGNVLNVTTGDVSICAWAKLTEDSSADTLIGKKNAQASSNAGYLLDQRSTDDFIELRVSDGTTQRASRTTTDPDGSWHQICGTFDSSSDTTTIYVDGTQEDTDTGSAQGSISNSVEFAMGERGNEGNDLLGLLAYGMQFGAVVTSVEINEFLWKPNMAGIASLGGFWPLWGENPEQDLSGNGLTGTVNGATGSEDGPPVMFGGGLPL